MAQRIVFSGKQQVSLESFEPRPAGAGQLAIRALCSLMSTGTENIVLNRLFEPATQWDDWVKYPFYPGYSHIGVVAEVGPGVPGFSPGDVVATRSSHSSYVLADAVHTCKVPIAIDPQQAAWFALAKIAAMGARAAQYVMGDSVLIIGAGPIGQMAVRWAYALGVEKILVLDTTPRRLQLARRGGATDVITAAAADAEAAVLAAGGGLRPRVVIDSTGAAPVFSAALRLADRFGRLVLLGDTGSPSRQSLTSDVITRGLTIAGAHDTHEEGDWTLEHITRYFFSLAASSRMSLAGLNTHSFSPAECGKAYELANTRRGETMGILFDWANHN